MIVTTRHRLKNSLKCHPEWSEGTVFIY